MNIPTVYGPLLLLRAQEGDTIEVGSQAWFTWLDQQSAFRFSGTAGTCSLRKEQRPGGSYWYAYRRQQQKLRTYYLGRTQDLTLERMEQAVHTLALASSPAKPSNQEGMLVALDIMRVKVIPPPPRPDALVRPQVQGALAHALHMPLTVLSTSAGYGKTTALADWCRTETGRTPIAWVALDRHDGDSVRFWNLLLAALEMTYPGFCFPLTHSQPLTTAPTSALLRAFVDRVAAWPRAIVVILDDYQWIDDLRVHETLATILEHAPTNLHVIISTRVEPPLPLARLRSAAQLSELSDEDLRFTPAETVDLLTQHYGLQVSAEQLAMIEARMQGWPVGVQLFALALRRHPNPAPFLLAFAESRHYVLEYLLAEVLDGLPPELQAFILHTSVLERLNGSICAAVSGRQDSSALLEYLVDHHLFVTPLDTEHHWYQYHPVVAQALCDELERTEPSALPEEHRAAATWFAQEQLYPLAIEHALVARDFPQAAGYIKQIADELLLQGEVLLLNKWLEMLPETFLRTQPPLCVALAMVQLVLGRPERAEHWIAAAAGSSRHPSHPERELEGRLLAARAFGCLLRSDTSTAVALAQQALAALPQALSYPYGIALWVLGAARHALSDDVSGAVTVFAESERINAEAGNVVGALLAAADLGHLLIAQGRLHQAMKTLRQSLRLALTHEGMELPLACLAHIGVAEVLREWNDLDGALFYITQAIAQGEILNNARVLTSGYQTLALIRQARGEYQEALSAQDQAEVLLRRTPSASGIQAIVAAQRARLELQQSQLEAATRWATAHTDPEPGVGPFCRRVEELVLVRVYLAQGAYERGLALLDAVEASAEAAGHLAAVLEARLLRALLRWKEGDHLGAVQAVEGALALAMPEGFVRLFVDERDAIAPVLEQWFTIRSGQVATQQRTYVRMLLTALGRTPRDLPEQGAHFLTSRELAILHLLEEGLSTLEIALRLTIAQSTVKWHLGRLYTRLGARNRMEAVVLAQQWHL